MFGVLLRECGMGQEVPLSLCFDEDDFGKRRSRAPAELFFHEPWEPVPNGDDRQKGPSNDYRPWEHQQADQVQPNYTSRGQPQWQQQDSQQGSNGNRGQPQWQQQDSQDPQTKKLPWDLPRSGFAAPWEKTFQPDAAGKTAIAPEQPPNGKDSEGDLPPDWRDAKDPKSGRTYYWNVRTRERQWVRPEFKKSSGSGTKKLTNRSPSKSQGLAASSASPMKRNSAPPSFSKNNLDEAPNKGDTVILKKGFAAALQRGIAQHGESGLQVTMQQGLKLPVEQFEEEEEEEEEIPEPEKVPTGPIPANQYRAQPGDKIDEYVEWYCHQLEPSRASNLIMNKIQEEGEGAYEIAGRFVRINWTQGQAGPELIVREAGEADVQNLQRYLRQAADVAFELSMGASAITQVPKHLRMSFPEGPNGSMPQCQDRFEAMRLARNEAAMREQAAQTWTRNMGSNGLNAPNIFRTDSNILRQPSLIGSSPLMGGGRTVR